MPRRKAQVAPTQTELPDVTAKRFVAVDKTGTNWLLETKGQENLDVARKDLAAARWCENATKPTASQWRYLKVPQKEFETLQASKLAELDAFAPSPLWT